MDGYQTPPAYAVESCEYTGGEERNQRLNYILGILFNETEMERFNRFFPQAVKQMRFEQQEVILEPERMTFQQYLQLKILKQEEEQMLRTSGEPYSQVMNRLKYYEQVMDVFKQMEQTYLEISLLLSESMPDEAVLFRQQIQRCNVSEMHTMFQDARLLLQMNLLHP